MPHLRVGHLLTSTLMPKPFSRVGTFARSPRAAHVSQRERCPRLLLPEARKDLTNGNSTSLIRRSRREHFTAAESMMPNGCEGSFGSASNRQRGVAAGN